ncbi:uncharacterized protein LOC143888586 [Tasmannia lanceolata]|uniref:uncharacterized protein LOC143888586 n=1 Tax=Tasmannia lanceolata TaxID=3420 RepID=UPI0040641E2B
MKLNPTKCTFCIGAGKFLGFMVSQRGIEANPKKIKAVMELTPPRTIREVQRLTGLVAALGRFISKSAERCLPFFNAVKGIKTTPWTSECQAAFEELKQYLSSLPLLSKPEPREELILDQISASREARIRPRYGGQKVKAVFAGAYDQGLDGTAPQVLADFITECTMPDSDPGSEAAPPLEAEPVLSEQQIEAEAVPLPGLESAAPPTSPLPCSEEPLWEIQGVYEAREERMIKYLQRVRSLASKFESFEVIRVPRTENAKANVLSKLAASGYTALREIRMEFLKTSSIDGQPVVVMQVDDEPCWMDEIIRYVRSGELPGEKKEARKVVQRASRFSLDGEALYKRSYTLPYLKCLRPTDALYALRETHEGICGEHLGGKALAIKVLLRGLYWPTLRQDALSLVKKCEKCQKFSPAVHQPAGIKKRLDDKAGRWADELYHVLWAYRTTPRTATGESPFNLSFGTEAVIPVASAFLPQELLTSMNGLMGTGSVSTSTCLRKSVRSHRSELHRISRRCLDTMIRRSDQGNFAQAT